MTSGMPLHSLNQRAHRARAPRHSPSSRGFSTPISLEPRQDQLRQALQPRPGGLERLVALRIHAERHDLGADEYREQAAPSVLIVGIDGRKERSLAEALHWNPSL